MVLSCLESGSAGVAGASPRRAARNTSDVAASRCRVILGTQTPILCPQVSHRGSDASRLIEPEDILWWEAETWGFPPLLLLALANGPAEGEDHRWRLPPRAVAGRIAWDQLTRRETGGGGRRGRREGARYYHGRGRAAEKRHWAEPEGTSRFWKIR